MTKIFITRQDINHRKILIKRAFFENKLTESAGKIKDLRKALKSLGLPYKNSFCEVKSLKINNSVQHDVNSVLGVFKIITQFGGEPCTNALQTAQ